MLDSEEGEEGDNRSVVMQLDAIERALSRGDVSTALRRLTSTRRRLLGKPAVEATRPAPVHCPSTHCPLTEREVMTLRLLPDACLSQKDIARTLGVSRNTVKSHLKAIYQKLGAHSRAEAIETARQQGIIGPWHPAQPYESNGRDAGHAILATS